MIVDCGSCQWLGLCENYISGQHDISELECWEESVEHEMERKLLKEEGPQNDNT